jgi:hypothetical protein
MAESMVWIQTLNPKFKKKKLIVTYLPYMHCRARQGPVVGNDTPLKNTWTPNPCGPSRNGSVYIEPWSSIVSKKHSDLPSTTCKQFNLIFAKPKFLTEPDLLGFLPPLYGPRCESTLPVGS